MSPAATDESAAAPRPVESFLRRRGPALAVAAVSALVAMFLIFNARDASHVRAANEAGAAGRYGEAIDHARRARRAPAAARALVATARAQSAGGTLREADAAWAAAARRDPNNWQVHYEWAVALVRLGAQPELVRRRYARARELNPRLPPGG